MCLHSMCLTVRRAGVAPNKTNLRFDLLFRLARSGSHFLHRFHLNEKEQEKNVMRTLKEMVVNNQRVRFSFYRDGQLWYETECGFRFPVPISDAGTATFLAEDRAMLFMRYIRKQIAALEIARQSG
ncbi:MAG TPA: hypothetical protein VFO86_01295 [Terriglobia bacterium]|nr:hypothetical protein [Terriglobia bacterium]